MVNFKIGVSNIIIEEIKIFFLSYDFVKIPLIFRTFFSNLVCWSVVAIL